TARAAVSPFYVLLDLETPLSVTGDPMATAEGQTQFLDALVVALSQACDGGKKRWYASTLELQLASLEICRVCRSISTLHWELPLQDLLRTAAIELWTSSEYLELEGSSCAVSLRSVVWPRGLTQLAFDAAFDIPVHDVSWPTGLQRLRFGNFNQPVAGVVWPASLQQLSLGRRFNQPITGVMWPASL
ncbi:unnamed protein product, partial [Ectocarpus fasciculatus]